MGIYKEELKEKLKIAKKSYDDASIKMLEISVLDEDWEEHHRNYRNKLINYLTAKSRLENLNRSGISEEYLTPKQ